MFEALKAQQTAVLANVGANPNVVFSDTVSAIMSQGTSAGPTGEPAHG